MCHIHLIETAPLGHGPLWLGYLLDALLPCVERVTLTHPDLPPYAALAERAETRAGRLRLRPIRWRSDKRSWPDTLRGGAALRADLTLLTFLDVILKKYRRDLRKVLGAPIWGIWFLPNPRRPVSALDPRRLISGQARGRFRDQHILRHVPDWLSGVFVLDDLLRERISPREGLRIEVLPDPWPTRPDIAREAARERLGLPMEARLFLHFGVPNPRKGLCDSVRAWDLLAERPELKLLRAGRTLPDEAALLAPLLAGDRAILRNMRIADDEVDQYFRACDWVLLPYHRHEGSSGLLSAAAAARRPVIASDYGVIGHRTRAARLGLLFEHGSPHALARAVRRAASMDPARFDRALASYAGSHDLEHLKVAVRRALGLEPPA